jgi:hypothetical protein
MHESCEKHQFESAIDVCRTCGRDFCGECLVYPFGDDKAPYCLDCALSASGVRSAPGKTSRLTKKEIKARHKQWRLQRASAQRQTPAVEVAAFEEFETPTPTTAASDTGGDNPLSWLDDHLEDTGKRVPF